VTGQLRRAALVAQASGSGKTKSAYDLALKGEFTAVVSTVKSVQRRRSKVPGPAVDALSRMATAAGKKGAKVDGETPMLVAMGVYLEWASLVLRALPEADAWPSSKDERLVRDSKMAILAATFNGNASAGLAALAELRLKPYEDGLLTPQHAAAYYLRGITNLHKHLPKPASVVLVIDEAPALMHKLEGLDLLKRDRDDDAKPVVGSATPAVTAVGAVSASLSEATTPSSEGGAAMESRSALHALTEAVRTILDQPTAGGVCMVGTYFSLSDLFEDRYSALRGRTTRYTDPCAFTTAEMTEALQHYFRDLKDKVPQEIVRGLHKFEGRPIHFCDTLLPKLLRRARGDDVDDVGVVGGVGWGTGICARWPYASTRAWKDAVDLLKSRLENALVPSTKSSEKYLSAGTNASDVLSQLLHAAMLRGGILRVHDAHAASRLVEEGILVWTRGQHEVNLSAEPTLLEALRKLCLEKLEDTPVRDYVGDALVSSLVALGPTAKGSVLQEAGAWGLLRTSLLRARRSTNSDGGGGGGGSLAGLGLSLLGSVPLPARLKGMVSGVQSVEVVVDSATPFRSLFDAEDRPRTGIVFIGWPNHARVDLAYWAVNDGSDGGADPVLPVLPVLVLAQLKSGDADLAGAVRAVTPAWQYVEEKQRAALARGSVGAPLTATHCRPRRPSRRPSGGARPLVVGA
jgi:hypothetical protein